MTTEPTTPASEPRPDPGLPVSTLTCRSCGKKNRIRPSERGAPHCGSCGSALPWLVEATDATFDIESRSAVAVLVDLWAPWCGPGRVVDRIVGALPRDQLSVRLTPHLLRR